MADELDPRLEARLRTALRAEAEAVPFTVRGAELEGRAAERLRARSRERLTILASAAVVAIAVGGVALVTLFRPGGDAAQPPTASPVALPSFERLLGVTGPGRREIARAELGPTTTDSQAVVDEVTGLPQLTMGFACTSGAAIEVRILGGPSPDPLTLDCTGGLQVHEWETEGFVNAEKALLEVAAPAGVAWRVVLATDDAAATPPPFVDAGCVATADGLVPRLRAFDSSTGLGFEGERGYRKIGNGAAEGDPLAWVVDRTPWDAGMLSGPSLVFDVSPACVERWDLRVARTSDVETAIANGSTPPFEPFETTGPVGHTLDVRTLPDGDLTIRVEAAYWTDGRPAAREIRFFRVFVRMPRPTSPAAADPVLPDLGFRAALLTRFNGAAPGQESTSITSPVPKDADRLHLLVGCSGIGVLHVDLDGAATDIDCVASFRQEFVPAANPMHLTVRPDGTVRYLLAVYASTPKDRGAP